MVGAFGNFGVFRMRRTRLASSAIAMLLVGGAAGAAPEPVKIAVFDFELEDVSAGSLAADVTADAAQLTNVTNDVRRLLAESGRYQLVDVANADRPAAETRTLRDCGGCEAAIARTFGADQSLLGVVRRVSRTEYTVSFRIRDTRTNAVVSEGDTGLRMGADYSWNRGAARLIKDRLLETPERR